MVTNKLGSCNDFYDNIHAVNRQSRRLCNRFIILFLITLKYSHLGPSFAFHCPLLGLATSFLHYVIVNNNKQYCLNPPRQAWNY